MSIEYKNVVPWGRNFSEYCQMFNLKEEDKKSHILGVGDGPASFNYEGNKKGYNIKSIDPIYKFSKSQISKRIEETFQLVIDNTSKNLNNFVWETIKNIDELTKIRMEAMNVFLDDLEKGISEKRYIYGELPNVNLEEKFDLALASHFLFLYSDNLDYEFHINSITKVMSFAKEFRIFPIYDLNNNLSKHLKNVIIHFENLGYSCELVKSSYDFLKNGNEYLTIKKV